MDKVTQSSSFRREIRDDVNPVGPCEVTDWHAASNGSSKVSPNFRFLKELAPAGSIAVGAIVDNMDVISMPANEE